MAELPTGTVTFLFTDIEGSTKLWEKYPEGMKTALARHDEILRTAIEAHGGYVFKTVGDAFCAAFATAPDALEATLKFQLSLSTETWGETGPLKVRASLHTGAAEERDGDYYGPPVNRVARLLSAGHGGQTIFSQSTYELVRDELPEGASLDNLGEHRLKDLARPEHVFQLVSPDLASDFTPLKTLDTRPNNLPAQPTPLIGREKEVEAVSELLLRDDVRLVSLTGPGGTGKTRLGLQVGADMIEDFNDGVFFVSLASITDADLVTSTIAHTLGVQKSGDQPILVGLKSYLKDKSILLVLDNFEQVASAAPLVSDLLATCPLLKVLVTSREVLHLQGEREYQVLPLSLPDLESLPPVEALSQYEAVELFIQRALALKPDFSVTNENAPAVAEICSRLDGLPLAIELAASRINLLTPKAILTRLSSRMKLLTGGARDLPARQQTIRNAIAWSYDLLDESEKILFRCLSVFVGGCTLEAAEEVCNTAGDPSAGSGQVLEIDIFDGVASLVDKSLLKQEEVGDEPRFVMLETVREYGLERLRESGEEEDIRQHHLSFFLALAEAAEPELHGPGQVEWMDRLEVEHDNLRTALGWSLGSGKAEAGMRMAGALQWFWNVRSYLNEGREWLERVLAESRGASTSVRAKALDGAGALARIQGDYTVALSRLEESVAIGRELGDKEGIANSLFSLGLIVSSQREYGRTAALWEESLSLYRELGDKWGIGHSLRFLGSEALTQGDHDRATELLEEGLNLLREAGDKWGIAESLRSLGRLTRDQGKYSRAEELLEESLALWRELGDKQGIALSLRNLGHVAYYQDDYKRAQALLEESLVLFREVGAKWAIPRCMGMLAIVVGAQGRYKRAARLFGATKVLREAISAPLRPSNRPDAVHGMATVRAELGEEVFEAAWAEGRAMSMEEAIYFALEEGETDA